MEMPYMQFFPADYARDTRVLSLSAKGAWMDLICAMWHPARRGVLDMRLSAFGRLIGSTEDRTAQIIAEIEETGIADVQWSEDRQSVCVTCRRVVREWAELERTRVRQSEGGRIGAAKRWGSDRSTHNSPIKTPIAIQNSETRIQNIPPTPKKPKPGIPSTELAKRIAALFSRRLTTAWSGKEIKAFKEIGEIAGEDLDAIERYYAAERAKGEEAGRHRRDLLTFLNNFPGELDRAHARPAKPEANAAARKALSLVAEVQARLPAYRTWVNANYAPELAVEIMDPATAREDVLREFLRSVEKSGGYTP